MSARYEAELKRLSMLLKQLVGEEVEWQAQEGRRAADLKRLEELEDSLTGKATTPLELIEELDFVCKQKDEVIEIARRASAGDGEPVRTVVHPPLFVNTKVFEEQCRKWAKKPSAEQLKRWKNAIQNFEWFSHVEAPLYDAAREMLDFLKDDKRTN